MTGRIQIEEEQKSVTRNSLNSEQLDNQTRLIQSERNYFDRNMILNLKQFEAIFCASLPYRSTIAAYCKTSPVMVKAGVNGKVMIEVKNYNYSNSNNFKGTTNHEQSGNNSNSDSGNQQKAAPANLITCSRLPHAEKWQSLISG